MRQRCLRHPSHVEDAGSTALVLVPLVLAALFLLPPRGWGVVLLAVTLTAAHEWSRLARFTPRTRWVFVIGMFLICAVLLFASALGFSRGWPVTVVVVACGTSVLFWLAVAPLWIKRRWPTTRPLEMFVAGWIVLIGTWVALVELQSRSPWLVLAAMAVVWIADTAAYFSGRAFGRKKLAPKISPGKTWEGVYGGFAAVAVYAACLLLPREAGLTPAVGVMAIVLARVGVAEAAISVIGDLRRVAAKAPRRREDSGKLLPGHGGVLDRTDACSRRCRSRRCGACFRSRLIRTLTLWAQPDRSARRRSTSWRGIRIASGRGARGEHGLEKLAVLCGGHRPQYAAMGCRRRPHWRKRSRQTALRHVLSAPQDSPRSPRCRKSTRCWPPLSARQVFPPRWRRRAGTASCLRTGSARHRRRPEQRAVQEGGATLLPIDSEHNAIFQCCRPRTATSDAPGSAACCSPLPVDRFEPARSPGTRTSRPTKHVHPEPADDRGFSVDSATMMNKGLEVRGALAVQRSGRCHSVSHPQSVIHSLVEYVDSSVLAEVGHPDMRTPIAQLALRYRIHVPPLGLAKLAGLGFEAPITRAPRIAPCVKCLPRADPPCDSQCR
jgi:phosphatidate cytidylyltransferase